MQGVLPGGEGGEALLGQLALIQPAVEGPGGLGEAVLCGGDRHHGQMGGRIRLMAQLCGLAEDLAGELVPADIAALVGGVIDAVSVGLDHVHQEPCQIEGVGGRADLVVDHGDAVMGLSDI